MAVEKFVADYPGVTIMIIGVLFAALAKLITQTYKHLTDAVKNLTTVVANGHNETREYREKDKAQVGMILDRLQKQETLCLTVRSFCPHANRHVNELTEGNSSLN